MKLCVHCGKEIVDETAICPECGSLTELTDKQERTPDIINFALAFSLLVPIIGLILGIIGVLRYKKYKSKCVTAIFVSIGVIILMLLILRFTDIDFTTFRI